MASGRSRWPLALALLLGLAPGCRESTPVPSSQAYGLRLETRAMAGRGQSAWLEELVSRGLTEARWFRPTGSEVVAVLPLSLRYEERQTEAGVPVLRVELAIAADAALEAALKGIDDGLEATVELERRDRTVELKRDLPIAVERAIAVLDAKVTSAQGDPAALSTLLTDDDPEVVLIALDGIERRRLHALGADVYRVLDHHDERVGLRAVECLGVVGGPEHAPGLVRNARLADRAHANRLYDALANLGGEHARGFLEFAARNEEDPELASLAERALARLSRHIPRNLNGAAVARGHRQ